MAQVTQPTPAKKIHDRGNKILSVVEAKPVFIRHTDGDGAESITLAYIFGEADYGKGGKPEDRLPGIWAVANMKQLQENMRLVTRGQAMDIMAVCEEKGIMKGGKLSSVVEEPQPPDVSGSFDELADENKG